MAAYHHPGRDKNMDLVTDHLTSSHIPQAGDRPDDGLTPLVEAQAGDKTHIPIKRFNLPLTIIKLIVIMF